MRPEPSPLRHARSSLVAIVAALLLVVSLLPGAVIAADPPPGLARKLAPPHASDRVIVGFEPGSSAARRASSVTAVGVSQASPLAPDTAVVTLAPGQSVGQAIVELSAQPGVEFVEPDYILRAAVTSDDPYYTNGFLWGMHGDGTSHPNEFGSGAGEAWAQGYTGDSSVYVAVIDEGVDYNHADLSSNVWTNPIDVVNGLNEDGNEIVSNPDPGNIYALTDDIHGWDFYNDDNSVYDGTDDDHGTHVAGTIGASGGNTTGVVGVNWDVGIIPVKFLGPSVGYTTDAVAAISYVIGLTQPPHSLNIVAINASWGGDGDSQALENAINDAGDAGILFVAAAGNQNRDTDVTPYYPASYECTTGTRSWDCIISVANLTSAGSRYDDRRTGSNYGSTTVDLAAPGTAIYSTTPSNGYSSWTGTSMAAPHVAGAVALCASVGPSLSASQIRSHVIDSVMPTPVLSGITATGGRLDIPALLGRCGATVTVPDIFDLDAASADALIAGAGLVKGAVDTAYSDTVAEDLAVGSVPSAGTTVAMGSAVDYTLSLGRPTVPDLVGKTVALSQILI